MYLAYNTCMSMSERGQCPDNCESCNLMTCHGQVKLACHWVFWLHLLHTHRFHVVFQSVGYAVLHSPESLPTNEFRLPFHRPWFLLRSVINVEAALHERVYHQFIWQQIQMKTEDMEDTDNMLSMRHHLIMVMFVNTSFDDQALIIGERNTYLYYTYL
jgi:hypothetical protein